MIRPTYLLHFLPEWKHIIDSINPSTQDTTTTIQDTSYYVTTTITSFQKTYYTVMYNKLKLNRDEQITTLGLLRSVVLNDQKRVIAFSPPKTWGWEAFVNQHPIESAVEDSLIAEEWVEGTQITLFWDVSLGLQGAWEMATRRQIGGAEKNTTEKSVRDMFLEAADYCHLPWTLLDTRHCYHFVLQHPDCPRIHPYEEIRLYLVDAYEISTIDSSILVSSLYKFEREQLLATASLASPPTKIRVPTTFTWSQYSKLVHHHASMNTPYYQMGVVVRNELSGMRTKHRNPHYDFTKHLQTYPSTMPSLYHYICLLQTAPPTAIGAFLKQEHGAAYRPSFAHFRRHLHAFSHTLHQNYYHIYVTKICCYADVPTSMHRALIQLHQLYTQRLLEKTKKKACVTRQDVKDYIRTMSVGDLLVCLLSKEEPFSLVTSAVTL